MKKIFMLSVLVSSFVFSQDFWMSTAGPAYGPIYSIVCKPNNDIFVSCGRIYQTNDNGDNWALIDSTGDLWDLTQNSVGHLIAGSDGNGVRISTDDCGSWTQTSLNENKVAKYLYVDASDGIFAGCDPAGLYYSADGNDWQLLGLLGGNIQAIIQNTLGDIFMGIWGSGVFRSNDFGENWVACEAGLTGADVRALAMNSAGDIFVGTTDGGAFRSLDNGDSWLQINTGLSAPYIFDFAINSQNDIYAATYYGIFRSTDNGDNWEDISTGVGAVFVRSIAFAEDGTAYAGTESGLIFKSVSSTTSVEEPAVEIPATFSLSQNFPNPFNGGTRIVYSVPVDGNIQLDIFDLTGALVQTLVSGQVSSGSHTVELNSNALSSGVYFYRLQTESGDILTQRLTILK